jgi:hypothetical protein
LDDIFNRKELDLKKYRSCGMDLSTLIFLWWRISCVMVDDA